MGDINSKSCIDALQGANLIQSTQNQAAGKNNIVVVNPEIHLHSNNGHGTSESMNNDRRRIKELENELKVKQDQIDLERGRRLLEERERCAENIRVNKLLHEKENQILEQHDLLSWHTDIVKEKRACLGEAYPAYLYGQSEKRFRMDHGTADGFQQANKKRKNKKRKRSQQFNRSLTTNYSNGNAHNYHGQRIRSKTEINFRNDPMESWEWNGTKWIMIKANGSAPNDPKSSETSSEQQKQNSIQTIDHSTGKTCDEPLQTDVTLTNKASDNDKLELPSKLCEEASNIVHCLDDTSDKRLDVTNLSHQQVAVMEISVPSDISISFDEREISRFVDNDVTLFAMPKRTRQLK
ncbi:uncharacterized protein LOC119070083 isoform X2 [Bradysia coprophila]|uniref:uncharacterized protein LOC119070083 isoform X2 n=1 Tax=Bradysia coprophila TaxID=38358 RepID=UPI00187D843E|nr:uncharacterized protein LOC119070083 isoform X2 [Bradysia coprophila]